MTSTSRNEFMLYRIIIAIFAGLVCFSVSAQQKEQRVALVIGNSSYKSSPLKNPVNDARDMANSLRGYGFTVIERTNLTTRQIGSTLREFRSKLTPGSVAVVFYAGHGVQIKGENYLPTVDAEINGEEDVPLQSLSTKQVMDVLGEAKTRMNLVFLDSCRDNPYARSFRSGSRGIAKENAPSGTLFSFATRPGSVAGDGDGRNGLYTSVLLEQIKQSNQPIEQVLKRVVSGVKFASKGQQEPWIEGSIEGDFCFGVCQPLVGSALDASSEASKHERFWSEVSSIDSIAAYQAYIDRYPNGDYSKLAKAKIYKLSNSNTNIINSQLPRDNYPSGSNSLTRYAFVNVSELLKLTGKTNSKDEIEKLNIKVKDFAEKFQIKLILQEAVYTNPISNVTSALNLFINQKPIPSGVIDNLPVFSAVKIGFVNTDKIFKNSQLAIRTQATLESEFKSRELDLASYSSKSSPEYLEKKKLFDIDLNKRKNEEFKKVLEKANRLIKNFADKEGIDLVLQSAVYVSPDCDISDKIILELR